MTQLDDRRQGADARWPGLFTVPSGPRTRVSAAVARRLFAAVVHRFDLCVVTDG